MGLQCRTGLGTSMALPQEIFYGACSELLGTASLQRTLDF